MGRHWLDGRCKSLKLGITNAILSGCAEKYVPAIAKPTNIVKNASNTR
jgi:hypothetical protein